MLVSEVLDKQYWALAVAGGRVRGTRTKGSSDTCGEGGDREKGGRASERAIRQELYPS